MGKTGGFLAYTRRPPRYRQAEERLRDYAAVELPWSEPEVREQAARCMNCGTPFCHAVGCPAGNFVPEINDLAYRGRWQDALELLLACNPFPEFTGRLCPALCEAACVLAINDEAVSIRNVELEVVETGFRLGLMRPKPPRIRLKERIAVVGSGPAGLAAGWVLNRLGYNAAIFEADSRPGGMLRYGIPDFKLEKHVIDRRVALMQEEGVAFECSVVIGKDMSLAYLARRYDALILCCGARRPRDLAVPGREAEGVCFALPFLMRQNKINAGEESAADEVALSAEGKHVVVIGGGDTGADCVGTALRQGAASVTQLEIMPEPPLKRPPHTPWPQWPAVRRDSSSHKEGGARLWSVTAEKFIVKAGCVAAVSACEVEWRKENNALRPKKKAGSEFELPAELVILAMGFSGPERYPFLEELGLATDNAGVPAFDDNGMTSRPGIFLAGDMRRGASLVVKAIADGMAAAKAAARWLKRGKKESEQQ